MLTDNAINAWICLNRDKIKPAEIVDSTNIQMIRGFDDERSSFFDNVKILFVLLRFKLNIFFYYR